MSLSEEDRSVVVRMELEKSDKFMEDAQQMILAIKTYLSLV